MVRALVVALLFGTGLGAAAQAQATVFYALEEVPALAFPEATRTEVRNLFLAPDERGRIEQAAGTGLDSDMLSVHLGWRGDELLGYAMLDTHMVRTFPEAFLVVLDRAGRVERTHILAFYEPLEYLPDARWLAKLEGAGLGPGLRLGHKVTAITGSTLSSVAVVSGLRRALAVYQELALESGRLPR